MQVYTHNLLCTCVKCDIIFKAKKISFIIIFKVKNLPWNCVTLLLQDDDKSSKKHKKKSKDKDKEKEGDKKKKKKRRDKEKDDLEEFFGASPEKEFDEAYEAIWIRPFPPPP